MLQSCAQLEAPTPSWAAPTRAVGRGCGRLRSYPCHTCSSPPPRSCRHTRTAITVSIAHALPKVPRGA
eukprot:762604-Hanusia_phi.AAC.3